jgi:transposase
VKLIAIALYFHGGLTVHDVAHLTNTSTASLYRWVGDKNRTDLIDEHLNRSIVEQKDSENNQAQDNAGEDLQRKVDKRRHRISNAAKIAKKVADSIAVDLAMPKPRPAPKLALKKERRGKRSAAQIVADVLPIEQNDNVAAPVVAIVRARRKYAKSLSMQKLARAIAQAAAHVHVTPSILAAARKRAADAHDRRHKLTTGGRRFLINRVKKDKFLDCAVLRATISRRFKKEISDSTIYNYLAAARMSYKKTSFRGKLTDATKLAEFRERISQTPLDSIVSLDEASFNTHMVRRYGWSSIGEKCIVRPKEGTKRETFSLMMAVSSNEVVAWQLVKGSFNKVRFLAFLEEHLIPAMQYRPHLQHLLMDNVPFHKSAEVREMLEEHDYNEPIIFNPPYHPDTNPVEMVFSSLKSMTRKRAPRNEKEIEKAIKDAIAADRFNLPGMFRHAPKGKYMQE